MDQTSNSNSVSGQATVEVPNRIAFSIELPRTWLEFDDHPWTEVKAALADTVALLDRGYGYFAVREGV